MAATHTTLPHADATLDLGAVALLVHGSSGVGLWGRTADGWVRVARLFVDHPDFRALCRGAAAGACPAALADWLIENGPADVAAGLDAACRAG